MKYIFYILIVAILSSCQVADVSDEEEIDSRIVSKWITKVDNTSSNPSPPYVYRAWEIASDGRMYGLRVNGQTGELVFSNPESSLSTRILSARNGKMIVRHSTLAIREDTVSYQINANTLIIEGVVLEGIYSKASIGEIITNPPDANLSVNINGTNFENRHLGSVVPTAYISKISDSELLIRSPLSDESHRMSILIENFQGSGSYILGVDQGSYSISEGYMTRRYTTISDSSGTVTLNCNQSGSTC